MKLPIDGLNLVAASLATAIFVIPTFLHITADLATRSGRNFSIIVNKLRHFIINLVRLGMIGGVAMLNTEIADSTTHMTLWIALAVLLLLLAVAAPTARRLTINAATGVVRWQKINLPWWPAKTTFVDQVSLMKFSPSEKITSVLGIGKLAQFWSVNYNGNVSTSGHNTERMLDWMAQQVNDYIKAFRRHDSDEAKATRAQIRQQYHAARAPKRQREKAQAKREKSSATQKAADREAEKVAKKKRKEEARRRKVDDKFR